MCLPPVNLSVSRDYYKIEKPKTEEKTQYYLTSQKESDTQHIQDELDTQTDSDQMLNKV